MAWLNATPEVPAASGRQGGRRAAKQPTRLERYREAGAEPPLPPIEHASRLLQTLLEMGIAGSGGMGPAPLPWSEIADWCSLTAHPLRPWEARAIRQASVEYVAELVKATDAARPAPWVELPTDEDRTRVASGLRAMLSANASRG